MAETKAKQEPAKKAERKKPVRKAPVQKDYPTKLDWLKAMTEYEEAETAKANVSKVERLDKRITAKQDAIAELQAELNKLVMERTAIQPYAQPESDEVGVPDSDGLTEQDHLVLEGKS